MSRPFELQGHRGARGLFAENTIEGFLATLAVGVSSLELDVAVTRDGVAVVAHDPALHPDIARDATGAWPFAGGKGKLIHDLTLAEVQTYDVGRLRPGSAYGAQFPAQHGQDGLRIPTLAALFTATEASGMVLDVELKTDATQPDATVSPAEMATLVVRVAEASGGVGRLVIRSFDWRGLAWLQLAHPHVPLAWLSTGQPDPAVVAAASHRRGTWAPAWRDLSAESIAEAHALGLRVVPWTVNAPADMARLIGWGVDGICTDRPDLARAVMQDYGLPLPRKFALTALRATSA